MELDKFYEWLYDQLGWGDFNPPERQKRSLHQLYEEIMAIVPVEKTLAWFFNELSKGGDMMGLLQKLEVVQITYTYMIINTNTFRHNSGSSVSFFPYIPTCSIIKIQSNYTNLDY